jgi:hypothetical protein
MKICSSIWFNSVQRKQAVLDLISLVNQGVVRTILKYNRYQSLVSSKNFFPGFIDVPRNFWHIYSWKPLRIEHTFSKRCSLLKTHSAPLGPEPGGAISFIGKQSKLTVVKH